MKNKKKSTQQIKKLKQNIKNSKKQDNKKTSLKDLISDAIVSIKEANPNDVKQNIHFFDIIKKELKKVESEKKTAVKEDDSNEESDISSDDIKEIVIDVKYGAEEEEFLAANFYGAKGVDYLKMFYGEAGKLPTELGSSVYAATSGTQTESETLETQDAMSSFMNVQYAAATGAFSEVDFRERNKLDIWIKFNSSLFKMMETMYSVTSDVNYGRLL